MDSSNALQERMVGLVGGAMVTKRAGGDVWSYPNVHGDVIATADGSGPRWAPPCPTTPSARPPWRLPRITSW